MDHSQACHHIDGYLWDSLRQYECIIMSRIRDIANLFSANTSAATDSEVTAAISAHNSSTTTVHGISDTAALATSTSVASDIASHNTTANGHVKRGNTASRPASPTNGDVYMNTQLGYPEFYNGSVWIQLEQLQLPQHLL